MNFRPECITTRPTSAWKAAPGPSLAFAAALAIMVLAFGVLYAAGADWPRIVPSKDGTPISFEVFGAGEPTLVFVHGWCCDARYWREQVPYFSKTHRVVVLDLAGHGHSGMGRTRYTMESFGQDVRAVTEAAGGSRFILIGHSMGGPVVAEAARLMPGRVEGIIGVDTLKNVELQLTRDEVRKMTAPMEKDFPSGCRQFIGNMLSWRTDSRLKEWITADMSAAPPAVGISAMNEMMEQYVTGEAARVFDGLPVPVVTLSSTRLLINAKGNRKHMAAYESLFVKNSDHFMMLGRPEEFNPLLEKAIGMLPEMKAQKGAAKE